MSFEVTALCMKNARFVTNAILLLALLLLVIEPPKHFEESMQCFRDGGNDQFYIIHFKQINT